MKKKPLFLCYLVLGTTLCACQTKEDTSKDTLPTKTPVSATTSLPTISTTSGFETIHASQDQNLEQILCSLVEEDGYQNVVYVEKNQMVSAIVSKETLKITSDTIVEGKGAFYIVLFDKQNEELLLLEKKLAVQGFQTAFLSLQETVYLPVLSLNEYCGVEYYDMSVYRIEQNQVAMAKMTEDGNDIAWWQKYKPEFAADGTINLYARKTENENFTKELLEEIELYHGDSVQTKQDYAERFAYTWELDATLDITGLNYTSEQNVVSQSRVFADMVEQYLRPINKNTGEELCGITYSAITQNGCQLVACKELGTAQVAGVENLAILLYDTKGNLVDFAYYATDEVRITGEENQISVFAGYHQQSYIETVINAKLEEQENKIVYEEIAISEETQIPPIPEDQLG